MIKFIINADDCGISSYVDFKIEEYIRTGKISSTTIMANMDDFEGAYKLYEQYKEIVSFGVHLNLTEGKPLTSSEILLDHNFYIERENQIFFNPENQFYNGFHSKLICNEILKEASAQIEKIMDHNISISHLDSHHHVHTRPFMLFLLPRICKKYNITKVRRLRNLLPPTGIGTLSTYLRNIWWHLVSLNNSSLCTTDYFNGLLDFEDIIKNNNLELDNRVIELMVHPGGFQDDVEAPLINKINILKQFDAQLINYNSLSNV